MKDSNIQWTDNTQNFWIGCTKVSPGCAHCYAEARDIRFAGGAHWGKGAARQRTAAANWRQPLKWNREAEGHHYSPTRPEREMNAFGWSPHRPRVFCSSLSDIFDAEVPIEWFAEAMNVVRECRNMDWQLLTKRPENFKERVAGAINHLSQGEATDEAFAQIEWLQGWQSGNRIPANIWMGTSVENQECGNLRVPALLMIPAKIRFLSCEPLIGPVDLTRVEFGPSGSVNHTRQSVLTPTYMGRFDAKIHWVIIGGESGANARPFAVEWARSLVEQCRAAGVAAFVKQLGAVVHTDGISAPGAAWPDGSSRTDIGGKWLAHLRDKKGGDVTEWPEDLRVREFPEARR